MRKFKFQPRKLNIRPQIRAVLEQQPGMKLTCNVIHEHCLLCTPKKRLWRDASRTIAGCTLNSAGEFEDIQIQVKLCSGCGARHYGNFVAQQEKHLVLKFLLLEPPNVLDFRPNNVLMCRTFHLILEPNQIFKRTAASMLIGGGEFIA